MKKLSKEVRKKLKQIAALIILIVVHQVLNYFFEDALWSVITRLVLGTIIVGLALFLLNPSGYQSISDQERENVVPKSGT